MEICNVQKKRIETLERALTLMSQLIFSEVFLEFRFQRRMSYDSQYSALSKKKKTHNIKRLDQPQPRQGKEIHDTGLREARWP